MPDSNVMVRLTRIADYLTQRCELAGAYGRQLLSICGLFRVLHAEFLDEQRKRQKTSGLFCLGVAVVFLITCWQPGPTMAAATKDQKRERQALRRMQQQLTEVQQQKSAAEQETTALEEALKKTYNEVEMHKRSTGSAVAKARELEKDIEAANMEKIELRARLDEAAKQNQAVSAQRDQLEQDLKNTGSVLAKENEQRKLCEANNSELYRIGRQLVEWYGNKGAFNAILEAEPFTRMKGVEMENLLENYREKLEGQRLEPVTR
ncbi:DNA repair protein [Nitrosospira sp. Is2]|uniref:DNA repair protein n=1 Tax=Nitrosospira sp. Is2 TaxID=3080532 RepID=UPI0029541AEC|nr:DNA repair protein [Nitrosospira sp. Is2]WON75050.1 DNA repair protein [Nitrosospira sp. Is2]